MLSITYLPKNASIGFLSHHLLIVNKKRQEQSD